MTDKQIHIPRRHFLKQAGRVCLGSTLAASAICAASRQTLAAEQENEKYDFYFTRVKFSAAGNAPDKWNVRPGGDANLLKELSSVIRCKTKPIPDAKDWSPQYAAESQLNAVVTFDEPRKLRKYPFLFMTGENYFEFTSTQKDNFIEYIRRGGFIFMDDCVVGNGGDFFYQSSFRLIEELFGKGSVQTVPATHEVFHNVYDLSQTGLPYMQGQNYGAKGLFINDRLAIFLSSTDLHCGWVDSTGEMFSDYKKALQMGVNIIVYAMSH